MITFQKIEHAVASVAHDIVKVARAVVPVLRKVQGQEATVEALTSLVDPQAVNIERAAFAVLGKICVAINDAAMRLRPTASTSNWTPRKSRT